MAGRGGDSQNEAHAARPIDREACHSTHEVIGRIFTLVGQVAVLGRLRFQRLQVCLRKVLRDQLGVVARCSETSFQKVLK